MNLKVLNVIPVIGVLKYNAPPLAELALLFVKLELEIFKVVGFDETYTAPPLLLASLLSKTEFETVNDSEATYIAAPYPLVATLDKKLHLSKVEVVN